MFSKEDIILVTGASSGIGRAIALECAALGATVLAQGRSPEKLSDARNDCVNPENWRSQPYDFRENMEDIHGWVKGLASAHGKLFGLAHCAGAAIMDSLRSYSYENSARLFDLDFHVPMLLAKGFADRRSHLKGGSILFMASAAGLFPEKGHLSYGAAKAALICAAKSMSQELAPGIRVNCLAPGIVETPMQEAAEAFMGPDYRTRMLADYPMGFGQPGDIAQMAVFLLSRKARWITGQNIVLSGGRY